ncbi:MAG: hypothetical protein PVS2B2_11140 [Candidatus Acidiferrum sp.]
MEQATLLDLLQIIGILLKVFALVVLSVTLSITIAVVIYALLQSLVFKSGSSGPSGQRIAA